MDKYKMNGEYQGVFLRKGDARQSPDDELFDEELVKLGIRYHDRTRERMDGQAEAVTEEKTAPGLWERVRTPVLFLALVCFMGVSAHLELMDPMIAVPGMCLCSGCLGWNARWQR